MGKPTIFMAIFHSYVSHYQRVSNKQRLLWNHRTFGIEPSKLLMSPRRIGIELDLESYCKDIIELIAYSLGKLYYFTNLNSSAIKGDDFPNINHEFQGSVVVRSWSNLPRSSGISREILRKILSEWFTESGICFTQKIPGI